MENYIKIMDKTKNCLYNLNVVKNKTVKDFIIKLVKKINTDESGDYRGYNFYISKDEFRRINYSNIQYSINVFDGGKLISYSGLPTKASEIDDKRLERIYDININKMKDGINEGEVVFEALENEILNSLLTNSNTDIID